MRGISNQYFFKSQESLATVIDTVSDNDENEGDDNDKTKDDKSGQNNNAPLAETEDESKKCQGNLISVFEFSFIGTKGALRGPMTNDDNPTIPIPHL